MKRLASVAELDSAPFRAFMAWINGFARANGLRIHENWSKIWEYPWIWQHIHRVQFRDSRVLDLGSEISPMPWFFASLGATVEIVETDPSYLATWCKLRDHHGYDVSWNLVSGSALPLCDGLFDLVTSYSVLEHMPEKEAAINEAARVLKPGGLLCLTFDICEPALGMSFPEWNGVALDMSAFDRIIWDHAELEPLVPDARWNTDDIGTFLAWHRGTAPHHNYTVGGAVLRKRQGIAAARNRTAMKRLRAHQIDTGLGSGNTGDDAMFLAACAYLPEGIALSTEVHSFDRMASWPAGICYIDARDDSTVRLSLAEADLAVLMGDTPIMDAWGLDWPLRSNAVKLDLLHQRGCPVHCVGIGVDLLADREALRIFRKSYLPNASWSVRSAQCREALISMGVCPDRIAVGADWAWLMPVRINSEKAMDGLVRNGYDKNRLHVGVNLVNERWRDDKALKQTWAGILDEIIRRFNAQVYLFCNESRGGDYYDRAAAESVLAEMERPAYLIAERFYSPDEMLSLISMMEATISQRYHFTLFSVLADVFPISIERGQKMKSLNSDLELPFAGTMEAPDEEVIVNLVNDAGQSRETLLAPLRRRREILRQRALKNFSLVEL